MSRAEELGCLSRCKVGQEGPSILFQFTDDYLVFVSNLKEGIQNLRAILLMFEVVFGLRVNLPKSKMMAVGEVPNLDRLADVMGCTIFHFPRSYLGLPLRGRLKSKHPWDPVIERVEQRFASWKRWYLSKGGRLTLMKATLSNLPVYLCFFSGHLHQFCSN